METITELKLLNRQFNKPKQDISTSSTFINTRNKKNIFSSQKTNSITNITQHLFHNYSTPKFPLRSSLQKINNTNLLLRLSLNKNAETDKVNDLNTIKETLLRNKNINTTKIALEKDDKRSVKRSSNIPQPEKIIKSPRTIFQKIIVNLNKLKVRTDKTIEVMKQNLKITGDEIKKRRKQEKIIQLMSSTYVQNLGERKKKKDNIINFKFNYPMNNTLQQSLYITNYKNKSLSNILPNISTNNNNNNQSISIGSSSVINFMNDTSGSSNTRLNNNNKNNISSSLNMNTSYKTLNQNSFYQIKKIKIKNSKNKKSKDDSDLEEKTNLVKIPEINLSSMSTTRRIKPLYPKDKYKRVYKNMYHNRNLDFPLINIRKQLYKIYSMPALLVEQTTFNQENEMNTLLINNKIRLIQDNIEYFKINIMYKNDFLEAFNNMESFQKAEFNYNLEEISCVLIKTIPMILQNYYEIIKKLISISIPDISQERLKKPETESQCLNLNYSFFNSSTEYFNICLEVYRILSSKVNRFIYPLSDFGPLNSHLDIARHLSTNIISMSNAFINKTKSDKKILEKMEVGLHIKKAKEEEIDVLERYHKRHRKQASEWELKNDRVNRALNMKRGVRINKKDSSNKNRNLRRFKLKGSNLMHKTTAFNSPLVRRMLRYFRPEIKSKIIALQVADLFEMKKNETNNFQDDENNENGSRKFFD